MKIYSLNVIGEGGLFLEFGSDRGRAEQVFYQFLHMANGGLLPGCEQIELLEGIEIGGNIQEMHELNRWEACQTSFSLV